MMQRTIKIMLSLVGLLLLIILTSKLLRSNDRPIKVASAAELEQPAQIDPIVAVGASIISPQEKLGRVYGQLEVLQQQIEEYYGKHKRYPKDKFDVPFGWQEIRQEALISDVVILNGIIYARMSADMGEGAILKLNPGDTGSRIKWSCTHNARGASYGNCIFRDKIEIR